MRVTPIDEAVPPSFDVQAPVAPAAANPLMMVHRLLAGRYIWATLLGIALACLGGTIAYLFVKPTYQSIGLIEVKPVLGRILYSNEQNGVMPMFDAFVETQASLLRS